MNDVHDVNKTALPKDWNPNDAKEYVSPEGVEEKIVTRIECFVTFTQGGRYRVYYNRDDSKNPNPTTYATYGEAWGAAVRMMAMMSALELDPEKAIDTMLRGLEKR